MISIAMIATAPPSRSSSDKGAASIFVVCCGNLPRMEIRAATAADVPPVLSMVDRLAALHEGWDPAKYPYLPNIGEMYRSWLQTRSADPRSVFLVAAHPSGTIVGFLVGTVEREIPIYRTKEFGFIHDMWVEPQYRNEGLARQMVMLAVERFRAMGMKQVRGETAAANDPARGLFERCGFRTGAIEMLLEI